MTDVFDVYLELGKQRVFASVLDWPGWCRSGPDEQRALDALTAYAPRYAAVADAAGLPFPAAAPATFNVVERVPGSATTDFGAPGAWSTRDTRPLEQAEAERLAVLVAAAWTVLARVVAAAPAELRKGPRGGGRDRDRIVRHVLEAEDAYARKLGVRVQQFQPDDPAMVAALRDAIVQALKTTPTIERGWPPRYAARRIAWHALDHAWEIEDRVP